MATSTRQNRNGITELHGEQIFLRNKLWIICIFPFRRHRFYSFKESVGRLSELNDTLLWWKMMVLKLRFAKRGKRGTLLLVENKTIHQNQSDSFNSSARCCIFSITFGSILYRTGHASSYWQSCVLCRFAMLMMSFEVWKVYIFSYISHLDANYLQTTHLQLGSMKFNS